MAAKKKIQLETFDVAEHLRTPKEMAAYLDACIAESDGDSAFIAKALGDIARAQGMSKVARDAGVSRESLYRALSGERSPDFATILKVTRALGVEDSVQLEVNEFRVEDGDLFLFCSDGLSDMVRDERMATLLVTAGTLEEKCHALVDAANDAGGRDNISVILTQASDRQVRKGLLSRMLGR